MTTVSETNSASYEVILVGKLKVKNPRVNKETYNFLNHVHNLLLDKVEALSISSGGTTDDIVHLDIIIFFSSTTAIHGVGEFDEHGILLHNALDMLATDADDSLVVLIGNME